MSDVKEALDAKAWLDRLSLMSRSSTCDIHPTEAKQLFEVFSAVFERAEKFDRLVNVAQNIGGPQKQILVTGK